MENNFNDMPNCLFQLGFVNKITCRNNYLFSLGIYYKAIYRDDFEKYVISANSKLDKPLPIAEVNGIINAHKKKDYHYRCAEMPIKEFCAMSECKIRN